MPQHITLCRYHYDPLDRLASRAPLAGAITQGFYKADTLATEVQGGKHRSFLRHEHQWLACEASSTALLTSDRQHSVLSASVAGDPASFAYTPYGHRERRASLPGFNGELADPLTGHYLLGNGYRAYSPILMRFNSPDSLSPFGRGGLNVYAYCAGDPVNGSDPSGHMRVGNPFKGLWRGVTRKTPEVPGLKSPVELLSLPRSLSDTPRKGLTDLPPEVFAVMQHNLFEDDILKLRQVSKRVKELSDGASRVNLNKYLNSTVSVNKLNLSTGKGGSVAASDLQKLLFSYYSYAPGATALEVRRIISRDAISELLRQDAAHKLADRRFRRLQGRLDYSPSSSVSSSGSQDTWLSRYSLDLGQVQRIRD